MSARYNLVKEFIFKPAAKVVKKVFKPQKTTADQAFNYIATGKPEMPVGGQKRMLAEKKRNSKAY